MLLPVRLPRMACLLVLAALLSLVESSPRQLTESPSSSSSSSPSSSLLMAAFCLLCLLALLYYDRRRNYRWITAGRHCVGECVRRVRQLRRGNLEKSMRIETEEVLPTPKASHVADSDRERPFIEAEPASVLEQPLTSPSEPSDPIGREQLVERQAVDLKNVFQQRGHKSKGKKEKKSKSKLKSRLQSHSSGAEEQRDDGQEEENSFGEEASIDEGTARGTEVE